MQASFDLIGIMREWLQYSSFLRCEVWLVFFICQYCLFSDNMILWRDNVTSLLAWLSQLIKLPLMMCYDILISFSLSCQKKFFKLNLSLKDLVGQNDCFMTSFRPVNSVHSRRWAPPAINNLKCSLSILGHKGLSHERSYKFIIWAALIGKIWTLKGTSGSQSIYSQSKALCCNTFLFVFFLLLYAAIYEGCCVYQTT